LSFEDELFEDEQPEIGGELSPILENSFASYGDYQLVGHGEVGSKYCGSYVTFGCLNHQLHGMIDGKYKGKVYVRKVRFSCGKPSCPICYEKGWAVREAFSIEDRLKEASKYFGDVEHIIATVPPKFYGLSLEDLRKHMKKILIDRGVVGGVMIFHGFRYDDVKLRWYWSPHMHILGFILGGYKCRGCKSFGSAECRRCNGFLNRTYRCFEKDGCVVKVKGKRKTVGGTAWYQLNHASIKIGVERFHVATWFGVCSYRKMKVSVEERKRVCPICHHDLEKLRYNGNRFVVNEHLSSDEREFFDDAFDDLDFANWVRDERVRFGG